MINVLKFMNDNYLIICIIGLVLIAINLIINTKLKEKKYLFKETIYIKVLKRFIELDTMLDEDINKELYTKTKALCLDIIKHLSLLEEPLIGLTCEGQAIMEWHKYGSTKSFITITPKDEYTITFRLACSTTSFHITIVTSLQKIKEKGNKAFSFKFEGVK
jgi:hypothetical protein